MRALALVALVAGCVRAELVTCADGDTCPNGKVCDTMHGGCVGPDQLSACAGAAAGAACTTVDVTGACFDGVCLPTGCGNGVVEPNLGEVCDPPGPQCSADCRSNLTCGNGIVDAELGEQCDDGNLRNHDGCDSKCRVETLAYDYAAYRPTHVRATWAALDPAHGMLLQMNPFLRVTWGWDGTSWSLVDRALAADPQVLMYEPTLGRPVAMVGGFQAGIYDWDGTSWQTLPSTGGTTAAVDVAFSVGGATGIMTVGINVVSCSGNNCSYTLDTWSISTTTWAWTQLGSQSYSPPVFSQNPDIGFGLSGIYDVAHATPMFIEPNGSVLQWNGTKWTAAANSSLPKISGADRAGSSYVYDPDRGAVIAWGGCSGTTTLSCDTAAYAWNGSKWVASSAPALPASAASMFDEVLYDAVKHRTILIQSNLSLPFAAIGAQWTLDKNATAWQRMDSSFPPVGDQVVAPRFTPFRGGVTYADATGDTWQLGDSGWTQRSPGTFANPVDALAYDPVRDLAIAVSYPNPAVTMKFDGNAWSAMAIPAPPDTFDRGIAYDPIARRMVMVGVNATWALDSSTPDVATSRWTMIAPTPATNPSGNVNTAAGALAFDASCGCMMWSNLRDFTPFFIQNNFSIELYHLVGSTWVPAATPGIDVAAQWSARASVLLMPQVDRDQPTWESQTASLASGIAIPYGFVGTVADDPRRGVVRVFGTVDGFTSTLSVGYRGVGGDELCDGHDGDGDGLVDCADPDCWWSCKPACPPGTSC
jgi:cysteine-rich repeat protein